MTLEARFYAAKYAARLERATRSGEASDDAVAVEILEDAYPASSDDDRFELFCDAVAAAEDREMWVAETAYAIVEGTL